MPVAASSATSRVAVATNVGGEFSVASLTVTVAPSPAATPAGRSPKPSATVPASASAGATRTAVPVVPPAAISTAAGVSA